MNEICGELLGLNLYRETTSRIQQRNVQKILEELRRIGMNSYYGLKEDRVLDRWEAGMRWKILWDVRWLLEKKVEYCRN